MRAQLLAVYEQQSIANGHAVVSLAPRTSTYTLAACLWSAACIHMQGQFTSTGDIFNAYAVKDSLSLMRLGYYGNS